MINNKAESNHMRITERIMEKRGSGTNAMFQCAELIFPWLHPTELASISSTCKTLSHISKSITARRSSDSSRALDSLPIPFVNTVDDQPYDYFVYTPTQTLALDIPRFRQPWGSKHAVRPFPVWVSPTVESACGCDCQRCDRDLGCTCSFPNSTELTRECGPSCKCRLECGNRLTQGGVSVRLKIVKDRRKGWGLHADQLIRRGQFVCEYAGEILTTEETRRRQRIYDELKSGGRFSSALLVVREHLPSGKACLRMNIDATRIGNIARYINHSCDGGNLSTILVRSSGGLLPRLCFLASRDIQHDEELTFSYGDVRLSAKGSRCFCGSSGCFGILPSEHT